MRMWNRLRMWNFRPLGHALLIMATFAAVVLTFSSIIRSSRNATSAPAGDDQAPAKALGLAADANPVLVAGRVEDARGHPIKGAKISFSLYNADGQVVARIERPVKDDRTFDIRRHDLPPALQLAAAAIAAEASNHLTARVNVRVDVDNATQAVRITPDVIYLQMDPVNPALTLVVFFPAVFGLLLAVMNVTADWRTPAWTNWFAFGSTALWSCVVAGLIAVYVWTGDNLIPLFWPDLYVSSGVVVFAYLGCIIYVAYSVYQHGPAALAEIGEEDQRHVLRTLGGRVLVGPYVALTAYGIVAATFPTIRTGPFAAFFGFFTGLWIKPVLEMLNDVGLRLLSAESRQKLAERALSQSAAGATVAPVGQGAVAPADRAFIDAIEAARRELIKKPNVIGVEAAPKIKGGVPTGERAIRVYVYKKGTVAPADEVPATFNGIATDVVPLPPADKAEFCRRVSFQVDWAKLNRDHATAGAAKAAASPVTRSGHVLVLPDPEVFFEFDTQRSEFDVARAYRAVAPTLGDGFDFVAFVIDGQSWAPSRFVGDYSVTVFNDVKGINHYKGDAFSQRDVFRSTRLCACQVHSAVPLTLNRCLHELAHAWVAYATIRNPLTSTTDSADLLLSRDLGPDDPQGRFHWGSLFDDGASCMDYDGGRAWSEIQSGLFARRELADQEYAYCPLDLYLMGALRPNEVGPIRLLRNLAPVADRGGLFTATVEEVTIEHIIKSCGPRVPSADATPRSFRQAFVVVTADPRSGRTLAKDVDAFRVLLEQRFAVATGGRLRLSTTLD